MRNPLRTKKASSDTTPPGTASRDGIGRMMVRWATTTMATAMPRSPSNPRTRPSRRGCGPAGSRLVPSIDPCAVRGANGADMSSLLSVLRRPSDRSGADNVKFYAGLATGRDGITW